jgi:hypothetical protein
MANHMFLHNIGNKSLRMKRRLKCATLGASLQSTRFLRHFFLFSFSFHWSSSQSEYINPSNSCRYPAVTTPALQIGGRRFSSQLEGRQPSKGIFVIFLLWFLATDPGLGSIHGATSFSEYWVWNGVHSASWVELRASWVQLRSCLKEEVAAPVCKTEIMAVGIRHADRETPSIRNSWH